MDVVINMVGDTCFLDDKRSISVFLVVDDTNGAVVMAAVLIGAMDVIVVTAIQAEVARKIRRFEVADANVLFG
jgi:hypothetical protein